MLLYSMSGRIVRRLTLLGNLNRMVVVHPFVKVLRVPCLLWC
ncbi:hypothetical protein ERO13_D11G262150v2 [Gossypium hirsutum]|nr:hypothetical protein ERO13_D11G262150v2 [Gossypium hirsutum]